MIFLVFVTITVIALNSQTGSCQRNVSQDIHIVKEPPINLKRTMVSEDQSDVETECPTTYPHKTICMEKKTRLIDASECQNYTVAKNEILLVRHSVQPNPYICEQNFKSENAEMPLHFMCNEILLRFGCRFEKLIIRTDNTTIQICGDDYKLQKLPTIIGNYMSLTYVRKLFAMHGGYICYIQSMGTENIVSEPIETPQDQSNFTECFECGFTTKNEDKISVKIVSGRDVSEEEFPWMVYLRIIERIRNKELVFACGGSLISDKIVLTAAHCLESEVISSLEIIIGTNNIESNDGTSIMLTQPDYTLHPDYDGDNIVNDIAVIRLDNSLKYTDTIRPICLPTPYITNIDGINVTVAGWGYTDYETKQTTKILQAVDLRVVPHKDCRNLWKNYGIYMEDTQVCAFADGKDSCSGDSGGPLFAEFQGRWIIVGIVSYGVDCAHPLFPGVYTRVSTYIPWIKEQLQSEVCQ